VTVRITSTTGLDARRKIHASKPPPRQRPRQRPAARAREDLGCDLVCVRMTSELGERVPIAAGMVVI
jgi:hypothetical protein